MNAIRNNRAGDSEISTVLRDFEASAGAHPAPINAGFAEEQLDRLLTAFVTTLSAEPAGACFPVARRHRLLVRNAQEYIDANIAEAVRIQHLCVMLGTSYKTLERAFVSVLGVTPRQYLSVARLSRARRLLLAGKRESTRIADVALSCGYDQFGRFSADYRKLFGETPSRTLSQSG